MLVDKVVFMYPFPLSWTVEESSSNPTHYTEGKISNFNDIRRPFFLSFHQNGQGVYRAHCSKSSFFVQKYNFDFPKKLSIFFEVKNSWKCCGFGLFSCWQLWFHEKNCQKKIWVKNSWKYWGFVKNEFLDINLTFRIVCRGGRFKPCWRIFFLK